MNCDSSLLHEGARPLFGRFTPWKNGLLFVFEALNPEDTRDPNKGYLTYDQGTDPTGRFARKLMVERATGASEQSDRSNRATGAKQSDRSQTESSNRSQEQQQEPGGGATGARHLTEEEQQEPDT